MIENDTITMFHFWQAKEVLKEVVQKDAYETQIGLYQKKIETLNKKVSFYEEIVNNYELKDIQNKETINYYKTIFNIKDAQIKHYEKQNKKRKVRNGFLVGGVVSVSGAFLILQAIK